MIWSKEEIYRKVALQEISIAEATRYLQMLDQTEQAQQAAYPVTYPLSEGQKGIWVNYQYAPDSYTYNVPIAMKIKQMVDVPAIKRTLQALFDRHDSLRATFRIESGKPVHKIDKGQEIQFEVIRATNESEEDMRERVLEAARQPFDLGRGPLMRASLFTLAEDNHILLICLHHIVFDGISLVNFQNEFLEGYLAESAGQSHRFAELSSSYQEFVQWQQKMLDGSEGEKHRDYWLKQFEGELPVLELPLDHPRALKPVYTGRMHRLEVDPGVTQRLLDIAIARNTTMFTVMLTALNVLFHRHTMQEDILIGTPVAGRPEPQYAELIGYFVNMMVVRSNLFGNPSFDSLLQQVHGTVLDGLEHSDYPYYALIKALRQEKSVDSNLFQVSFSFQNWARDLAADKPVEMVEEIYQAVEYDLALEVVQIGDNCYVLFKYNGELFDEATIQRMAGHYHEILTDASKSPHKAISQLKMLTAAEWQQIIVDWNANEADFPRDKCVHELFIEHAKRDPNALAVAYEELEMTYGELDEKSSQLAYYLNSRGIEGGSLVGVFLERSINIPVVLLGILKAGAGYVPLDPIYPPDRLGFMLEEAELPIIVSQSNIEHLLPDYHGEIIRMDREWDQIAAAYNPSAPIAVKKPTPEDVAYILYTSGSTGKPKGVQVLHKGLTNVLWFKSHKRPGFTSKDRLLAIFTICFDMSVIDMFLPLVNGGTIDIVPESYLKDGQKLKRKVEEGKATWLQATPATCQMLVSAGWNKKVHAKLITGGDTLTKDLADRLLDVVDELYNGWGPTETSIYNSNGLVKRGEKITIGRPYDNNKFYVLDKYLNPVPVGVIGEAHLGGVQVSRGYLKRDDLTQKNFLPDPFAGEPGARMYKTGDMVRYLPDGRIDILGRADRMVKLRGFRIELEEVESALLKSPDVKEAIALVREDHAGHKQLIAFLKKQEDEPTVPREQRKEELKKRLPYYMVPTMFVFMRTFPLSVNLKIDKKYMLNTKLSEIIETYGDTETSAPQKQEQAAAVAQTAATVEPAVAPAAAPVPVQPVQAAPAKPVRKSGGIQGNLNKLIEDDLLAMMAEVTDGNGASLDANSNLEEQGLDSITVTEYVVKLKDRYGLEISPTLFFDYTSISKLASYFMNNHYPLMRQIYGSAPAAAVEAPEQAIAPIEPEQLPPAQVQPIQPTAPVAPAAPAPAAANRQTEPIAIVGLSARMPQSASLNDFWSHLESGRHLVTEIPAERWDVQAHYGDPSKNEDKTNSIWGSFLQDVDKFDAEFFNLSKRDSQLMDPQQRLLLEAVWHAIETAGYKPSDLSGTKTGVFVGVSGSDYADVLREYGQNADSYHPAANSRNLIANRVSYLLNLRGPSLAIDTDSSSSLVAIHDAVTALQNGDCDAALVGGVNLLLSPNKHIGLSRLGLLSSEGVNRVLDKSVNGYIRGEGIGVFLLKPLSQAERDGDHIHAVIRGSAVNHGGYTNSMTTPNAEALTDLLVDVYKKAQVDPATVSYIEVNGMGSILGDLTEVTALKQAFEILGDEFNQPFPDGAYCGLGSLKTNTGNLEGASGAAALLKVVLAMQNGKLPAALHLEQPNPYLELEDSPFYLLTETKRWEPLHGVRRAGICSYGFGGVNAHLIVEEYVNTASRAQQGGEQVIVLSAKDEEALKRYAQDLADHLADHAPELGDLAYTLQVGREAMEERLAIVATSVKGLRDKLLSFCEESTGIPDLFQGNRRSDAAKSGRLMQGAEGKEFIRNLIANRKLTTLAELFANGTNIDWSLLHDAATAKRVPLPAYPFAGERHWVKKNPIPASSSNGKITVLNVSGQYPVEEFRYRWQELYTADEVPNAQRIDVGKELYNMVRRHDQKMTHMLVQLKSGKRMEVVMSGKGKPMLMLNGFGLTASSWYYQYKEWSTEYQMINVNVPGVGLSDVSDDVTLSSMAAMMIEVLDELGIQDPVHVVAACWGGLVAQTVCATYHDRVTSLTLVNSISQEVLHDVERVEASLSEDFDVINASEYYPLFVASTCLNPKSVHYGDVITTEGYSTRAVLDQIKCPTLIIIGNEDIVIDRNESKVMNEMIRGSEYREMPGAAHGLFMTHYQEFNPMVMDFLKRVERRDAVPAPGDRKGLFGKLFKSKI